MNRVFVRKGFERKMFSGSAVACEVELANDDLAACGMGRLTAALRLRSEW